MSISNFKAEGNPLILSEETFPIIEQITTGMPGGFFIYHADDDEKLIYANKALIEIFGCKDLEEFKQHTGFTFRGMVHPEDREGTLQSIRSQIFYNKDNLDYVEYRIIRKNGDIRWMADYGHFVTTKHFGDIFYVFLEDVTLKHYKQIDEENAKRLLEDKLQAMKLLEHETTSLKIVHEILKSGMWTMEFNALGELESVLWSNDFRSMLGYKDEKDFPNRLEAWTDLINPEDREDVLRDFFETVSDYSGKKIFDSKYRIMTKNNGYRWFRSTGKLSRRSDGTPITYVGTFIDITSGVEKDRELAQQKKLLEEALEQAQHSNRAKTVFLNNMSHDIRTPMNAIIGFTNLASTHIDNKELVRDYLSKITSSSNHLLSLINDVLDMSRIESGRVHIEEKECSLSEIMHDLKTIVQADVRAKQINFSIDTLGVVNDDIVCDRLRLNQVLLNIVGNSIKFTGSGGTISVRVSQEQSAPKGFAAYEFKIRDSGIGMSRDFLSHIFEPFERERTSTVSGTQGTGLGMAITKNIVDMMNGEITVESEQGKGTEFAVKFKFRTAGNAAAAEKIPFLENARALVADDDFNSCSAVTKILNTLGLRTEWTASGKEAILRTELAMDAREDFDVFVLDWQMPDLNGVETARRIRRLVGKEKIIIIMTAYDWAEIESDAKGSGVDAFCSKPVFLSELRAVLLNAVENNSGSEKQQDNKAIFKNKSILLVEDNELNQEIAKTILEEAGFTVDTAEDGSMAVEKVRNSKEGQYDLVLMDIQMPVMDGYQATRKIRDLPDPKLAKIPIIAMTANAFDEDKQQAFEAGMDGHLGKPIEIDKLMDMLRERLLS